MLRQAGERVETLLDDILLKTAAPAMHKEQPAKEGGAKGHKESRTSPKDSAAEGVDDY